VASIFEHCADYEVTKPHVHDDGVLGLCASAEPCRARAHNRLSGLRLDGSVGSLARRCRRSLRVGDFLHFGRKFPTRKPVGPSICKNRTGRTSTQWWRQRLRSHQKNSYTRERSPRFTSLKSTVTRPSFVDDHRERTEMPSSLGGATQPWFTIARDLPHAEAASLCAAQHYHRDFWVGSAPALRNSSCASFRTARPSTGSAIMCAWHPKGHGALPIAVPS
jgi:hypothetical protein